MKNIWQWLIGLVAVVLAAALGYWWLATQHGAAPTDAVQAPPATAPASAVVQAPASQPQAPAAIQHPIEAPAPGNGDSAALPSLDASDPALKDALTVLLGAKALATFVSTDNFVRNATATVDNLALGHAASRLWPVLPAPGHIALVQREGASYIADENAKRYTPFVQFVRSIDMSQAASLYVRWYPLFQKAYEELGYPGKYFNDRLVAVIDQLLQTPEPAAPLQVALIHVQGSVPTLRPWVRYEFVDPSLESRPAGQKMLLRMGTANTILLKTKLTEFRSHIVKAKTEK